VSDYARRPVRSPPPVKLARQRTKRPCAQQAQQERSVEDCLRVSLFGRWIKKSPATVAHLCNATITIGVAGAQLLSSRLRAQKECNQKALRGERISD
jgi:hypothetical protein